MLKNQTTERQVEGEMLGVEGVPRWECRDAERGAGGGGAHRLDNNSDSTL